MAPRQSQVNRAASAASDGILDRGRAGRCGEPSLLRHVSPLGWDHIVLTGDYDWSSGAAERSNVRPLNLYPAKIRA